MASYGSFELLSSLKVFGKIPISEYRSRDTGLTVFIAEVDGPVVKGYFSLATEAFDNDGLPHTLEHLVFLGSEDYPYKGVLDLLANRCLASGTNAWTATDHTCYTMATAGSDGFLALMPIYLEHILFPTLRDEAFVTEVHHITGEGEDAGVVYSEIQARENLAEVRLMTAMMKGLYPGKCGYSSQTGGVLKNLRESTTNTKVRNYHKEFYRPENLSVIITGRVNTADVFKSLESLEAKIMSKGDREEYTRPWQSPVPPLPESKDFVVYYPADEEKSGIYAMAWRGPLITDQYEIRAMGVLMSYLVDTSISPLKKTFVEIPEPYASNISCEINNCSTTSYILGFEDVPVNKIPEIKAKLKAALKNIVDSETIDLDRIKTILNNKKMAQIDSVENNAHEMIAKKYITHRLYANTAEELHQKMNPLSDFNRLGEEDESFWLSLLDTYLIKGKYLSYESYPSIKQKQAMAKEESDRVKNQIARLGPNGLKNMGELLNKSVAYNNRAPPQKMLTSIPIPSLKSVHFLSIKQFSTDAPGNLNLRDIPVYTHVDDLDTNFIYIYAKIDTSSVPQELRKYFTLLLIALDQIPIRKNGILIPYEEVVSQRDEDCQGLSPSLGLGGSLFSCGSYQETFIVFVLVEAKKYEKGLEMLTDILYNGVFAEDRLIISVTQCFGVIDGLKRDSSKMATCLLQSLSYPKCSNKMQFTVFNQEPFLRNIVEMLNNGKGAEVVARLEELRSIITNPNNINFHIVGNLKEIDDLVGPLQQCLGSEDLPPSNFNKINITPDHKYLRPIEPGKSGCVVGMGSLESSNFYQTSRAITSFTDPDLPALKLFLQYLTQTEGPIWKQVRGKGYAYSFNMGPNETEGTLMLILSPAANVVGAYEETRKVALGQVMNKTWDKSLLDSARSSLIFNIINEETTLQNLVSLSVTAYIQGVDYTYNRKQLSLLDKVTENDLNRVGEKYIVDLFDPNKVNTVIVTDPEKADEIANDFKQFGLNLDVYHSLDDYFQKF